VFHYHTEPQRQFIREHTEQLATEMRRSPDPTAPELERRPSWFTRSLLRVRRERSVQLRASTHHG